MIVAINNKLYNSKTLGSWLDMATGVPTNNPYDAAAEAAAALAAAEQARLQEEEARVAAEQAAQEAANQAAVAALAEQRAQEAHMQALQTNSVVTTSAGTSEQASKSGGFLKTGLFVGAAFLINKFIA